MARRLKRTRVFGLDRQAQAQGLEHRQQRLQCGIAIGRQRAVKGLAADAGLRRDDGQATVGFGYGAQGEQARGPVVGVVQRFQGGLEIFDGQLAIRSQFGDFRGVVRYRALELLMPASVSIPATTPGRP